MKPLFGLLLLLCSRPLPAQQRITIHIINDDTHEPIAGVTIHISPVNKTLVADSLGVALLPELPAGNYTFGFTGVGFREKEVNLTFPVAAPIVTVNLDPEIETMQDVVIASTRTNQLLRNSPIT